MPQNATCARCGKPLDAELPGGLCSACALTLAIEVGYAPASQQATAPNIAAASPPTTVVVPPAEGPGTVIDRYKLLQKIGEGGCGVVYMAEQEEPVHRRVALKVIKLGMDTKEVIARFEAERQALALMDHPNIAKVLDAGATETGRPYFVMELVRGIRITQFCDQHNLSTRERLDLFMKVCQAIQHAHQKGIIHRDIKPSNVMVASHDGVPVPKVIDFGIAKATAGRLTDKTYFTALEQFIGTPEPQASERSASSRRRLQELIHLVRGDLDWIVMKCLEKDRARRYETANGLAADLQRHLSNEPVVARPPSAAYRVQKFVRRNKGPVSATVALAVMLLLGVAGIAWQWREAVNARRGEEGQRKEAEAKAVAETEAKEEANEARAKSEATARRLSESLTQVELQRVQGRGQYVLGDSVAISPAAP